MQPPQHQQQPPLSDLLAPHPSENDEKYEANRRATCSYFDLNNGRAILRKGHARDLLSRSSIFSLNDPKREVVLRQLRENSFTPREDRTWGAFMGMVVGDALGAPLEFSPVRYDTIELRRFTQTEVWTKAGPTARYNAFHLLPGQWTDDASMGLCLAQSLLWNGGWNPLDCRLRFSLWWEKGLCNAFAYDDSRWPPSSVGLGGNISMSLSEFNHEAAPYTKQGDSKTSGNGSLMRLAPLPLFFAHDLPRALEVAYLHSKTTHQGEEAAECCRLLTFLIVKAVTWNADDHQGASLSKDNLFALLAEFKSELRSVQHLARSEQEPLSDQPLDRNWNWKDANFRYSPTRAKLQPGYVGSYSMDALAMCLHCVYSTNNLEDAMVKAANLRGDSDTVCAITGQLAGALYGVTQFPRDWLKAIWTWDPRMNLPMFAYYLSHPDEYDPKLNNQPITSA